MKEKTMAVVALWTRHRGDSARNLLAFRLEEIARSLRRDMHSGTFSEAAAGAGAVFIISEEIDEVDET